MGRARRVPLHCGRHATARVLFRHVAHGLSEAANERATAGEICASPQIVIETSTLPRMAALTVARNCAWLSIPVRLMPLAK